MDETLGTLAKVLLINHFVEALLTVSYMDVMPYIQLHIARTHVMNLSTNMDDGTKKSSVDIPIIF